MGGLSGERAPHPIEVCVIGGALSRLVARKVCLGSTFSRDSLVCRIFRALESIHSPGMSSLEMAWASAILYRSDSNRVTPCHPTTTLYPPPPPPLHLASLALCSLANQRAPSPSMLPCPAALLFRTLPACHVCFGYG